MSAKQTASRSADEFWAAFEAETGEKVRARTMGQMFSVPGDKSTKGEWGLVILTDSTLRFKHVPSENWFLSIMRTSPAKEPGKSAEDLVIPVSAIESAETATRTLFDRLFGSPFASFIVRYAGVTGTMAVRFAVDPKGDFPAALQAAVKEAR